MNKFFLALSITLALPSAHSAVVKQILPEQNLSVVELTKNEKIQIGDFFVAADEHSQCLMEVLSLSNRFVTVSTRNCRNKINLVVGKSVDKLMIDANLVSASQAQEARPVVPQPTAKKENEQIVQKTNSQEQKNTERMQNHRLAYHDLFFWPHQGMVFGATTVFAVNSDIKSTSGTITASANYVDQSIGVGLTDQIAVTTDLYYLTSAKTKSNLGGTLVEQSEKTGIQAPVFGIVFRNYNQENNKYFQAGLVFSPKTSPDNYLSQDYVGAQVSAGVAGTGGKGEFVAAIVSYKDTDTTNARTRALVSASYQLMLSENIFMRPLGKLQSNSNEEDKSGATTVKYNGIATYEISIGGSDSSHDLSWLISANYFITNLTVETLSTEKTYVYSGTQVSAGLGYRF